MNCNLPSWWKFYLVYAGFRNATVMTGVLHRYQNGQASNPLFAENVQNLPELLVNTSLKVIANISSTESIINTKKFGIKLLINFHFSNSFVNISLIL